MFPLFKNLKIRISCTHCPLAGSHQNKFFSQLWHCAIYTLFAYFLPPSVPPLDPPLYPPFYCVLIMILIKQREFVLSPLFQKLKKSYF